MARRLGSPRPPAFANVHSRSADTVLLCEAEHAALHRGQTILLEDGRRLNADGWIH